MAAADTIHVKVVALDSDTAFNVNDLERVKQAIRRELVPSVSVTAVLDVADSTGTDW